MKSTTASKPVAPKARYWLPVALIATVVAAPVIWVGATSAWVDAQTINARWTINRWREGTGPAVSIEAWAQARNDLLAATKLVPGNPQWYDDLAYLHMSRAYAIGPQAEGSVVWKYQQQLYGQAEGYYQTSVGLRPTYPYSWVYLALAKHLQAKHDDAFWFAFDKAYRFGNAEPDVQLTIAQIAFSLWPDLTPERKAQVVTMVTTSQEAIAKRLRALATTAKVELPA